MEPDKEYDISDEEINEIQNDEDYNSPKATTTRKNETPGGSLYYAPIVDKRFLPVIGNNYGTLDQCEEMYRLYAYNACFDIRKAGQKTSKSGLVKQKYYLCNKAGTPKAVNYDTLQETKKPIRKSNMECTGCRAKVRFDWVYGTDTFILADFEEQHNHELLPIEYRHLSKQERQMRYAEKLFVYHSTISNIGPTKAYEVYTNMKGSEKKFHGTVIDFRNWRRDLNVFVNATDSQMLVNKMEERKKYVPGFSFEYKLENSQLHSIFWADEVAKCNYKEFSDVISFDATYRTNRYNLKFVPFTGIDNHRRCVTVAAAMIRDETAESYTWLLKCFMKTFGKEPNMIVTDQDKSMAIAIKEVFKTAKHRLCMWHIMRKVPSKIQEANPDIVDEKEKDFNKRFDKIVWNMYIEPTVFEERWQKLMDDFSLKDDSWFKHMFDIRSDWIPAYFIDTEMFGLMRTTSRSESENAFFSHFTRSASNLLTFMDGFESAMLKQRSKQESLDVQTIKKNPKLLTMLKIERHALKVYTNTIFLIIQQEIVAALYKCSLDKMDKEECTEIFVVKEKLEKRKESSNEGKKSEGSNEGQKSEGSNEGKKDENSNMEDKREASNEDKEFFKYKVLHNRQDGSIMCTCRHYLRYGLLCRHCFWVLKNDNIDEIPEKYILRRWRRDIIPPELRSRRNGYGNENVAVQNAINEITSVIDDCVELIGPDETKLQMLLDKVKMVKKEVEAQVPKQIKTKDVVIQEMVGVSKTSSSDIQNPPVGRYKGCGKDKRLMSAKEKGILQSKKRKITCSNCGSNEHNCRGCDKPKRSDKEKD